MSVKKKLRVSKNRKKSWRKHTDIKEIEEFLDTKRFEERVGIAHNEAQDEDLFMIEKKGDDAAYQEKLEQLQTRQAMIDVGQSKLRKISSSLKIYKKLESTSSVPAVTSRTPNKERRKTVHNDDAKLEKFWNERKDAIQNGKEIKKQKQQIVADPKQIFNVYDLWDEQKAETVETEDDCLITPKPKIRVPEHLRQKPSLLPAIEIPDGGQSYNPNPDEHKELLMKTANNEMKKLAEEAMWNNKVEKYFVTKRDAPTEETWLTEMSQGLGLFEHEKEDDEEKIDDANLDDEIVRFSKLVKAEKKTRKQRRREMREKLAKLNIEKAKKLKVKENEVFRLKSIKKELDERDEQMEKRAKIRAERHIASMYEPKRLSRYGFVESEIPVSLPNELSGSLRTIKSQGNVLEDRFKSLQKRNIIEPRVLQNHKRKFKLKIEVKRRHRAPVE